MHTFMRLAILPFRFLTEPLPHSERFAAAGAVLYVIPLFMLRRRPEMLLWILLLNAVVGMALISDIARHSRQLEFLRYTIAGALRSTR